MSVILGRSRFAWRAAAKQFCAKPSAGAGFSHIDNKGRAKMVDVGYKVESKRQATASGTVLLGKRVYDILARGMDDTHPSSTADPVSAKGNVFTVAQLAGIMGAKKTPELIPLCHAVPLACVDVHLTMDPQQFAVNVVAKASTSSAQTGVEMEALTAVSISALTVYDMCKAVSKSIQISNIRLLHKSGGYGGDYEAKNGTP